MSATTRRGKKSRARILEAASELFHRRNVTSTSIDDVLEASGTGKSQFYHYFRSKEDLVQQVIQERLTWMEQLPEFRQFDSWESIRGWLDVFIGWQSDDHCVGGCPLGSMAAELADTHPHLREELEKGFAKFQGRLEKGLSSMKARKELRADARPKHLATFTFAALQGGVLLAKTTKRLKDLKDVCDHIMTHLQSFARE